MILWTVFLGFLVILFMGVPIGIALGASSAIVLYAFMKIPLIVVAQRMFTSVDSFSFIAVPFFMLAGAFMSYGGVTKRLVNFAHALVGALAGGLALVVCVTGMFFAAISGSSAATTAAASAAPGTASSSTAPGRTGTLQATDFSSATPAPALPR